MTNTRKKIDIKSLIISHILNNKKEYIIILLLFIIGLFLGVLFINNVQEEQFNNIQDYINTFVEKLKVIENIDSMNLLKNSLIQNIVLAIVLWFFGTTVIRNSSGFWNNNIQRILLRIHNFSVYKYFRNVERIKFCI